MIKRRFYRVASAPSSGSLAPVAFPKKTDLLWFGLSSSLCSLPQLNRTVVAALAFCSHWSQCAILAFPWTVSRTCRLAWPGWRVTGGSKKQKHDSRTNWPTPQVLQLQKVFNFSEASPWLQTIPSTPWTSLGFCHQTPVIGSLSVLTIWSPNYGRGSASVMRWLSPWGMATRCQCSHGVQTLVTGPVSTTWVERIERYITTWP